MYFVFFVRVVFLFVLDMCTAFRLPQRSAQILNPYSNQLPESNFGYMNRAYSYPFHYNFKDTGTLPEKYANLFLVPMPLGRSRPEITIERPVPLNAKWKESDDSHRGFKGKPGHNMTRSKNSSFRKLSERRRDKGFHKIAKERGKLQRGRTKERGLLIAKNQSRHRSDDEGVELNRRPVPINNEIKQVYPLDNQPGSNQQANKKQPGRNQQANRKQPGRNQQANKKQPEGNQKSNRKQPGSKPQKQNYKKDNRGNSRLVQFTYKEKTNPPLPTERRFLPTQNDIVPTQTDIVPNQIDVLPKKTEPTVTEHFELTPLPEWLEFHDIQATVVKPISADISIPPVQTKPPAPPPQTRRLEVWDEEDEELQKPLKKQYSTPLTPCFKSGIGSAKEYEKTL